MLFIYGALKVGGIETFFVRMARERKRVGLPTTILLTSKLAENDEVLISEMKKYSEVIFTNELFLDVPVFTRRFPLLVPVKSKRLRSVFANVDQIHVFDGMHALLGYRLSSIICRRIPITVGFYHYIKYLWGGEHVAHHERVNRNFIFDYLPKKSLLFFSEGNRKFYEELKGIDFSKSNIFRLGVVDRKELEISGRVSRPAKFISVGRLVDFKTYNLYVLDVVKKLVDKGFEIQLDVYGEGPLKGEIMEKCKRLCLTEVVFLKGELNYLDFDNTVSKYDIFIGSGTAIIQASSLGVPSIVGVENMVEPKTYGYFCDVYQYEYNLKGLNLPLFSVEALIEKFLKLSVKERLGLKEAHLNSAEYFTNRSCQNSMDSLKTLKMPCSSFKYNRFRYEISRFIDYLNTKLNKNHPRNTQFEDFRRIDEGS